MGPYYGQYKKRTTVYYTPLAIKTNNSLLCLYLLDARTQYYSIELLLQVDFIVITTMNNIKPHFKLNFSIECYRTVVWNS